MKKIITRNYHIILSAFIAAVMLLTLTPSYARQNNAPDSEEKIIEGKPRLEFDKYIHDFGDIYQDTVSRYTFNFTNTGDGTLVIDLVKPTCGCTATELIDKIYQPGESGKLEIVFKSGKFENKQHKSIKIGSNDSVDKVKTISLVAFVKRAIEVLPAKMNIPEIEQEVEHSEKLLIKNNSNELNLEILGITSGLPEEITTDFTEPFIIKPGTELEIHVLITPRIFRTKLSSFLRIKTNLPKLPEITVPVQAYIKPDLRIKGNKLIYPKIPDDMPTSRDFILENATNKDISILSIDNPIDQAKIDIPKMVLKPGETIRGQIILTPGPNDRRITGTIKLHINSKRQPEIGIQILASVRKTTK
jgi:Protein of unknown function (DUF1573)